MPVPLYWLLPALLAGSIALWPVAKERSRLRASLVFLALACAGWYFSNDVALAFAELACVQLAAVVLFDLALRRVHVPKFAGEILIVGSYLAILFGLLYKLGVNVTGIFATSAVATAVVGLALQDMLGNIAGGIALELEDEIHVGDYIQTDNVAGWVQHVRLRHTAVTTRDGDTLLVPNNLLTRSAVLVHSSKHRQLIPFTMPYDANPQDVIDAVESALRASPVPGIAAEPAPECVMEQMMPGHIRYAAVVWLARPGFEVTEISMVLMRIFVALQRAGMPAAGISQHVDLRQPEQARQQAPSPVDVLRRTPILRLLGEPDLLDVASRLHRLSFAPGERIIRQGDADNSMFFVATGRVGILLRSSDGSESQVSLAEPGDFFGEASLLTGERRSASAVAVTGVECYRLDKAGLQGTMSRVPDLAEDISVVMAHRQTELDGLREKMDRDTAVRREAENQSQLLARIRRFFSE